MTLSEKSREKREGDTKPVEAELEQGEATPPLPAFPIVGIGASAGALEAFRSFLQAMPSDSGMAFVLVPHLGPTHASMMTDLLASCTRMKVVEVENGMPVERDTVYVIPFNKYLSIEGGRLRLTEPVLRRGMRMPIDFFFSSMADDLQERAICMVFSGTGTDGTLGALAVKGAGGTVLVQDPASAQYDGMPKNAISTGQVDSVLPIDALPKALLGFVDHLPWYRGAPAAKPQTTQDDSLPIIAFLRTRTRHDFSCYKKSTLNRRIHRRMALRHADTYADYLSLLGEEPGEVKALLRDLLIGVTSFFRDADSWKVLEELVIPKLLARKDASSSLRVWVPGCSSGEEPYSLAMIVKEAQIRLGIECRVQIFASDIDEETLDIARSGVYPERVAADVPPELLERYFERSEGYYRVSKSIRDMVVFANQNLIRDPPFSRLDLISCRNLLIYLDGRIQGQVIKLLHFALAEGGHLFLGPSESVSRQDQLFEPVDKKWRIFRRIGLRQRFVAGFPTMVGSGDVQPQSLSKAPKALRPGAVTALAHEVLLNEYVPATVLVDRRGEAVYFHGPISKYLEVARGEPTRDIGEMVREGLGTKLRSALQRAVRGNESVDSNGWLREGGNRQPVRIKVRPMGAGPAEGLLLVTFEDIPEPPEGAPVPLTLEQESEELRQLEMELVATRADLQSTIEELETANEELKASNEEAMSMNEELQSANEELETSKEELQSLNEELNSVNAELQDRVQKLKLANNDISNLLNSTDIANIFLDRQFNVRRFTPATTRLFRLVPGDVGRSLGDFALRCSGIDLLDASRQVMERLEAVEREVYADDGRCYRCRVGPYRTLDDQIDGVVITFVDISENKAQAQALRTSYEQLELAQKGAGVGTWLWDLRTGEMRFSRDTTEYYGISLETIFDREKRRQRVPPDVLARVDATISEAIGAHESFEVELPIRVDSGETRWLLAKGTAQYDDAGHPVRAAGITMDVTRRKSDEERLRISEARQAFILRLNDALRTEATPEGASYEAARLLAEHLGVDRVGFAEDVGDGIHVAITRDYVRNVPSMVGRFRYDDFGPIMQELRLRRVVVRADLAHDPTLTAQEKAAWAALGIGAFVHAGPKQGGDLSAILFVQTTAARDWSAADVALIEDVAARVWADVLRLRAELAMAGAVEEMRIANERLEAAQEGAEIGIWDWNLKTNQAYWSRETARIYGLPSETVIDFQAWREKVPAEDLARIDAVMASEIALRQPLEIEFRIRLDSGAYRWILSKGKAFFDSDGHPTRMLGINLDITDRKRSEAQLQVLTDSLEGQVAERTAQLSAALAAKSEFLAHMSHEIRTPMNAVINFAQLLQEEPLTPEQSELVGTINEAGQSLLRIINDILDFSKIEAGQLQIERQPFEMAVLLARVQSLLQGAAERKGLGLIIAPPSGGLRPLDGDALRLEQVLVNLINNAIKFTEQGGVTLSIATQEETANGVRLRFEVRDTGIGIAADVLETLFQPFAQADHGISRRFGGTGLGLVISKQIVEMMGGKIGVTSSAGDGSTFWFEIPFDWAEAKNGASAPAKEPEATGPRLGGIRVLAADDNQVNLLIVEKILKAQGATTTFAADGQQALQILQANPKGFDVVLMDVQMPVMDGLTATRAIRANPALAHLPVIALTAGVLEAERERALAIGINDFLPKPIDPKQMIGLLASIRAAKPGYMAPGLQDAPK